LFTEMEINKKNSDLTNYVYLSPITTRPDQLAHIELRKNFK
jgi:hypothetical protein